MAKQTVGIGTTPNDGTGDDLRTGGDKINDNFDEIYTSLGDGTTLTLELTDPKIEVAVNAQTGTTYTLVLTDASKFVTMGNATSNAHTIPANASVAFPTGTTIAFQLIGAGTGSIVAAAGVTLNGVVAGTGTLTAQWSGASIIKTATDTWSVIGDIGTVA